MSHEIQSAGQSAPREPYCKPVLKLVPLRADEAVLGACKSTATGQGPGHASCKYSGASCSTIGS